jgi:hypothetical protein
MPRQEQGPFQKARCCTRMFIASSEMLALRPLARLKREPELRMTDRCVRASRERYTETLR